MRTQFPAASDPGAEIVPLQLASGSRIAGKLGSKRTAGRTAGSELLALSSFNSSILPVENSMTPNERFKVARGSPSSYATDDRFSSATLARQPPGVTCNESTEKTSCSPGVPCVSRQSSEALCGLAATLASAAGSSS